MKILIFGLGHLSSYMVEELEGFAELIHGTHRGKPSVELPKSYEYHAGEDLPQELSKDLYQAIIWSFPPVEKYMESLKKADQYFDSSIPWIFISSTSVYSEGDVTEESARTGRRFRGENLIVIEDFVKSFERKVSIVRPSGLIDESRNPARWIAQKKEYACRGESVNLVHSRDVARFIKVLLETGCFGEDFNLCSSKFYEKSFFYTEVIKAMGRKPPRFLESSARAKNILNSKSLSLGFEYLFDDALDFLVKTFKV